MIEYSGQCSGKLFNFSDNAYRDDFNKRLKILGITKPVQPYSLRHSFITRTLETIDLFSVMDLVGHTSSKTTQIYHHGNLKVLHKAIKKDPLLKESLSEDELFQMFVKDVEKLVESYGQTFSIETQKTDLTYKLDIALRDKTQDSDRYANTKAKTRNRQITQRKVPSARR